MAGFLSPDNSSLSLFPYPSNSTSSKRTSCKMPFHIHCAEILCPYCLSKYFFHQIFHAGAEILPNYLLIISRTVLLSGICKKLGNNEIELNLICYRFNRFFFLIRYGNFFPNKNMELLKSALSTF